MLAAAFGAAAVAAVTGKCLARPLGRHWRVADVSALQGLAAINFKGNQIIAGVAINMLAAA